MDTSQLYVFISEYDLSKMISPDYIMKIPIEDGPLQLSDLLRSRNSKPCDALLFDGKAIKDETEVPVSKSLKYISELLYTFGMPSNILGYEYVRYAIYISQSISNTKMQLAKILYPIIASRYETSVANVERAIRHAIEVTWTKGNLDCLQEFFGNTVDPDKGKPTNSQFISIVKDKMSYDSNDFPALAENGSALCFQASNT